MKENKIWSLVIGALSITIISFLIISEVEIISLQEFLTGFTIGITGSIALFSIIHILTEKRKSKKSSEGGNNTQSKINSLMTAGMAGVFTGQIVFKITGETDWAFIAGTILLGTGVFLIGMGTVTLIKSNKLKQTL